MSFAKRAKAGKFWQHTLICFLPSRLWRLGKRFFKSLWAGLPLVSKVVLISSVSFAMFVFIYAIGSFAGNIAFLFSAVFTAAIAFFLLRYAKRIHKLDLAAKAVSGGAYDTVVRADGKLMWRVLDNLLSNVFKYSLEGSRVYISTTAADGCACIDIKNISAAELNVEPSELMERFKRGDESRADGGSGLGLSIVQSFVEAQGGKFAVSIDGDLFKASVYLPLA